MCTWYISTSSRYRCTHVVSFLLHFHPEYEPNNHRVLKEKDPRWRSNSWPRARWKLQISGHACVRLGAQLGHRLGLGDLLMGGLGLFWNGTLGASPWLDSNNLKWNYVQCHWVNWVNCESKGARTIRSRVGQSLFLSLSVLLDHMLVFGVR